MNESFQPPNLQRAFACVVPRSNPLIGALVSCYFYEPGVYFPIFVFPDVDKTFTRSFDREQDGFIGQMMGDEAAVFINNAMVRLQPQKIILAGMNEIHKSYMYAYFPRDLLIEIDSESEVKKWLKSFGKQFKGTLSCKRSESIQGLVLAARTNRELQFDDSAESLPKRFLNGGKGLIILEYNRESHDLASASYALSLGADIVFVAPVERHQVDSVQKLIYEWKEAGSTEAYEELRRKLTKRLKRINILDYKFCTVFTRGLPYGLILKNIIPVTHVLANVHPDLFIFNNIAHELLPAQFDATVVFSPEFFKGNEETEDVIKLLDENNYIVRSVLGAAATVKAFDNYAGHFPYDVMHICSHGGETDGYYVVEHFADRTGKEHRLEYEEIVGFSPAAGEIVEVTRKVIFRRLDGFPWFSKEKESVPRYVFEDMRKNLFNREKDVDAVRVKTNYPIYSSCHVKCSDSIHQGNFHALASHSAPFVFNNTCSSWHEIAVTLIGAGARSYIGTLWKVGTKTAFAAAKAFYEDVFSEGRILPAFSKMINGIAGGKYEHVYMVWGLHFSTLQPPEKKSDQKAFNALVGSFLSWNKKFLETPDPKLKRNCVPVLNFISREIREKFTPNHMKSLASEVTDKIVVDHVDHKEEPRDDAVDRGVIDL